MPAAERAALQRWVERAHGQGRKVRFWNTPDRAQAWRILIDAGVDVIGTDDLDGLQQFLRSESQREPSQKTKVSFADPAFRNECRF